MSYANDMAASLTSTARTDTALASQLRISVARLGRRLRAERELEGLSLSATSVLGLLFREKAMTIGELAQAERVQPPSMTRTVNCLVEDGYVDRAADPDDGRRVVVTLTDEGLAMVQAERRRRDAWLAKQLRNLAPEEREVLRAAAPLLERLSQA